MEMLLKCAVIKYAEVESLNAFPIMLAQHHRGTLLSGFKLPALPATKQEM